MTEPIDVEPPGGANRLWPGWHELEAGGRRAPFIWFPSRRSWRTYDGKERTAAEAAARGWRYAGKLAT